MSKTILITGATDGIGRVTAIELQRLGHTVLLHGRNPDKLAAVAADLDDAPSYLADLSRLSEVVALAEALRRDRARLDVIINNAGIIKSPNTRTEDNLDVRFAVNAYAPLILTRRLLPLLVEGGRAINLSSAAQAPVSLDSLSGDEPLNDDFAAYSQSKLALTMLTRIEAARDPHHMYLAVNPGSLLATNMVKGGFGIDGNDINIGRDILVAAALDERFADASGQYWDNDNQCFADPHADALDDAKCETVVALMERVLESLQLGSR